MRASVLETRADSFKVRFKMTALSDMIPFWVAAPAAAGSVEQ